mmetsp:Transcript_3578/g.8483  ORF Transcript_3578/g.8483 Transcript_3578/m.8483 type:complete len:99 (-) Transcript_3578:226-522(-)
MTPQEVSNTLNGFGKLERAPGPEAWAALELAVVRVARQMNEEQVVNTISALVKLAEEGRDVDATVVQAVCAEVTRMVEEKTAQSEYVALWAMKRLEEK